MKFAYENLEVWNGAVDFAVQVIDTVEEVRTLTKALTTDELPERYEKGHWSPYKLWPK